MVTDRVPSFLTSPVCIVLEKSTVLEMQSFGLIVILDQTLSLMSINCLSIDCLLN